MFYGSEVTTKMRGGREVFVARVFEIASRIQVCRKEFTAKGAALDWAANETAASEASLAELRAQAAGNTFDGTWGC